eukprot:3915832-Prymnesium_polylepis.1
MEPVLGQIRIFFIIREMVIRNKPRIIRRIVEFFFFFSERSQLASRLASWHTSWTLGLDPWMSH